MPTIYRKGKKIHRNDPCYCGSGKKYKKCCLPKEQKHGARGNLLDEFFNIVEERKKLNESIIKEDNNEPTGQ